jgi:tetratricopeptide (TPR) repeat protein
MSRSDEAPAGAAALAMILGASRYPRKPAWNNPAFKSSAAAFKSYAGAADGMNIPADRILDLFGDERDEQGQCMQITEFLTCHRAAATDLVVYYVGHGGFAEDRSYYLGIKQTRDGHEFLTTLEVRKLARTIKLAFRNRRVYIVLDCCFAAAAVQYFQSDDIAQLVVSQVARDLPSSGTAFLAAASKDDVAIAPAREAHTVFTTALLRVLRSGMGDRPGHLSLYDLYEGIRDDIDRSRGAEAPAPQIHCPSQPRGGDVSRFPLFPNPAAGAAPLVATVQSSWPLQHPASQLRRAGFRRWLSWPAVLGMAAVAVLLALGLIVFAFPRQPARDQGRAAALTKEARAEYTRLRTGEAESLLLQAVTADPDSSLARADLAAVLAERGNYIKAQAQMRLAVAHRNLLDARGRLWVDGVEHEVNWRLDQAAAAYRQGWEKFGDAEAGLRLAGVQTLSGLNAKALDTLKSVEAKVQTKEDARFAFARALAAQGQTAAVDILRKVAASSVGILSATALSQLCWEYHLEEKPTEALESCEKAFARFGDYGDRLGRARTLARQAVILSGEADRKTLLKAETLLNQAIEIVQDLGADFDKAGALENRMYVRLELAAYDPEAGARARTDFEAASAIYRRIGHRRGVAHVDAAWALEQVDSCRFGPAREAFEKARGFYSLGDHDGVIVTANSGMMDYYLGDLAGAEEKLRAALTAAARLHLEEDTDRWATHLGKVYIAQDRLTEAETCFLRNGCGEGQPSAVSAKRQELDEYVRSDYALLEIEMGRVGQAENAMRTEYERLRKESDRGNAPKLDLRVVALNALARALAAKGDRSQLNEAWKLIGDAVTQSSSIQQPRCELSLELTLTSAQVAMRTGRFDEARTSLDHAAERATGARLVPYRLEALLSQAELDCLTAGKDMASRSAASASARAVADQARRAGFALIARKADELARETIASR